ncbi:MAG: hypothetical protein JSV44_07630 [Candidatus Zixiibacteriota bacterium]|nr:MAG: hypothetical protein JSV44_07630 [candidate division Zixibacteria bacterium]
MNKRVVILNSRQELQPVGGDEWIINTGQAVEDSAGKGHTILTSVGMNSWEITLFFASKYRARQTIFIPWDVRDTPDGVKRGLITQFHLEGAPIEWRLIGTSSRKSSHQKFQSERDRLIINEADVVVPVAVRPGGNLESLLNDARARGAVIDYAYLATTSAARRTCRIRIDPEFMNPDLDCLLRDYLIHWTRSCHGPWPGETIYQWYDALTSSATRNPRSALDTLVRVLLEKKLRSSDRHYRRGVPAVSFSGLPPSQAVDLMKWRARYREMTFEPYGIAVRRDMARQVGIRKVFYGSPEMYPYLEEENRPYFQSIGIKGYWMPEREYRHIGDLDLSLIPSDALAVIVWKGDDIQAVRGIFNGRVVTVYRH